MYKIHDKFSFFYTIRSYVMGNLLSSVWSRLLGRQSVSIRRESRIKNVYNSAAALSYNFALDTYHPLVSRRGRKDTAFPLTTSGRVRPIYTDCVRECTYGLPMVRPNSMKRVEGGWVHTPDFAPGSTPSDS